MEFEYTSNITINDDDFDNMMEDMANGWSAEEAFYNWANAYDLDDEACLIADEAIAELESRWAKRNEKKKSQPKSQFANAMTVIGYVVGSCPNHADCFFDVCPMSEFCALMTDEE